jgi:hypothetical protein
MCKDIEKYLSTSKHNTFKHAFIKQTTYAKTLMSRGYVCANMAHIPNPIKSYFIMSIVSIPKNTWGR